MVPFDFSNDAYSLKNYKDSFTQGKTIEDVNEHLIKHMAHWTADINLVRIRVSVPLLRPFAAICSYPFKY